MRRLLPLLSVSACFLLGSLASGCIVVHDHPVNPRPTPPVACTVPNFDNYQGNYPAFRIAAQASTQIAAGDRAYAITSNGNGTYHLTWTDTADYPTCFNGLITGIQPFSQSQVTGVSGYETIQFTRANQIGFASVPGASFDGIDFFATQDPVYLDVFADNSAAVSIYFTNAVTGLVETTGANPAAFSSP